MTTRTIDPKVTPINPRTGQVWRLSDPEMKGRVDKFERDLKDPVKAKEFLLKAGLITKTGKLPKRYGG